MNERLKSAMIAKHIDVKKIAAATGADPKTVQRWMSGRIPHARHRYTVAEMLKERSDYLWPEDETQKEESVTQIAEIISAYSHRADSPTSLWWQMFTKAQKHIDLLGFAMLFLPEQHSNLMPLLKEKGASGCKIRIAVVDPNDGHVAERDNEERLGGTLEARIRSTIRHFEALDGCQGVEIGLHHTPLYNSIFRFDDEMFFTPHLYGLHGSKAPLFHLRRLGPNGLFTNFVSHFENIWNTVTILEKSTVAVQATDRG